VKRFPATANPQLNDSARIAIDLFLDNPVIRYTHHPFFSDGQDAFNAMARIINQTQPRVRWASLGTISRHLYQIRRATSPQIDYEIEGFSREVVIRNPDSLLRRFRFWRQETAARGDFDVHIGDEPVPYRLRNDRLTLEFALGPYQQCTLSIQYPPPVQIDTVAFDKGGIRIQLTRYLSDFRDVVLGRTRIGTRLARTYYDRGGGGGRLKLAAALGAILLAGAGFLTWRFGFGNKRR
jgi:hypothetical protein